MYQTPDRQEHLVLASDNAGKIREIKQFFQQLNVTVSTQSSLNVHTIEETGLSFVENAIIKARNASLQSGLPAIADDSGIAVDALKGLPGIYSARFAGPDSSDEENLARLLHVIKPFDDTQLIAQFICVMVYLRHADDARPIITEGVWRGQLVKEPRGTTGFGYDPIFYLASHQCTAAELPLEVKNQLSHRGQALNKLVAKILNLYTASN